MALLRLAYVPAARMSGLGTELFLLDAFKMSHRADMHEDNVHLTAPYVVARPATSPPTLPCMHAVAVVFRNSI